MAATDQTERCTHGLQLPMTPRSPAVLGLSYHDRAGTKLFVETNWRGTMFKDPIWQCPRRPREKLPGVTVVNLRLAKERTVNQEWVFLVDNLFGARSYYWKALPAPGRTFELQFRARF